MLYREIVAVSSEIHIKHINTICGAKRRICDVKAGNTWSKHWALRRWTEVIFILSYDSNSSTADCFDKIQSFLKHLLFCRPARFARSKHCITATFTNWIPIGNNRANAPSNTLCIHFLTCFLRCTPEYHTNYSKIHIIFHRSAVTLLIATLTNIH